MIKIKKKDLEQNSTREVMRDIVRVELAHLWMKVLKQNPSNEDLRYFIKNIELLKEVAGKKLLERNPTIENILYVMVYVESLGEIAYKKLEEQNPTHEDLLPVIDYIEFLRRVARELFEKTKEKVLKRMKSLTL